MALSVEYTGKYTSERHEEAKQSGKLTAGEVTKLLNKKFNPEQKITAVELRPLATEWHHSGFYKPAGSKSKMGKTYFFDLEEIPIEKLFEKIIAAREEQARIEVAPDVVVYYFQVAFEKTSGRYGRTFWQPKAFISYIEIKACAKNNFLNKKTELSKDDYELLKDFSGRYLDSYETFEHFKTRMLK